MQRSYLAASEELRADSYGSPEELEESQGRLKAELLESSIERRR